MNKPTIGQLIAAREERRLAAPTDAELIEARERTDAGVRLAMPELAQQLGLGAAHQDEPSPKPSTGKRLAKAMEQDLMSIVDPPRPAALDQEAVQSVAGDLLDIRAALVVVGTKLPPLDESKELHVWVNALLNGVDAFGVALVEGQLS